MDVGQPAASVNVTEWQQIRAISCERWLHSVLQSCEHVWMDSPWSTFTCCVWEFTNVQFSIHFQVKIINNLPWGVSFSLKIRIYVLPILVTTYQIEVLIVNKSYCTSNAQIMRQWALGNMKMWPKNSLMEIMTAGQPSISDDGWQDETAQFSVPSSSSWPVDGSVHPAPSPAGPGTPGVWGNGSEGFWDSGTGPSCVSPFRIAQCKESVSGTAPLSADC